MTTLETIASWLLLPILLACLWRARLLALAIVPAFALAFVQAFDLVDTSSASHPLRFVVPILSLSAAMGAAWAYARKIAKYMRLQIPKRSPAFHDLFDVKFGELVSVYRRRTLASILVFASGCGDIPALLAWRIPGEWILVPVQIGMEVLILGVLCAPERWLWRWA
jgi:hypothetical protein